MPIYKTKNENFFKDWSPEMAYVLGFFAADGCMIKNNRGAHFIEFQITDKDILLKIRKLLGSNHSVSQREEIANCKTRYRLQIGSKEIYNDLSLLGFTSNKTKTLKMPDVPGRYLHHFVRGYFDGDGNVYVGRCKRSDRKKEFVELLSAGFTCGSRDFLDRLLKLLKKAAKTKGGSLYFRAGAYRLYFSINDSIKLYQFMYNSECGLCLNRKKKKFEKFIKIRNSNIKKGP